MKITAALLIVAGAAFVGLYEYGAVELIGGLLLFAGGLLVGESL